MDPEIYDTGNMCPLDFLEANPELWGKNIFLSERNLQYLLNKTGARVFFGGRFFYWPRENGDGPAYLIMRGQQVIRGKFRFGRIGNHKSEEGILLA